MIVPSFYVAAPSRPMRRVPGRLIWWSAALVLSLSMWVGFFALVRAIV